MGFQGTRFGSNERVAEAGGIGIRILILKGALGLHPGAASLPAQRGFPRAFLFDFRGCSDKSA